MKRLIEFPLEDGGAIVVEVDEPEPPGGVVRAARLGAAPCSRRRGPETRV